MRVFCDDNLAVDAIEGTPMNRFMVFLIAMALSVPVFATDNIPHVVLTGTGENEIAPHGEGNVYAPSVLIDDGKWKMWYGGQGKDGHDRISYAESIDGKQWQRIGVVLEDKTANHINDPSVIKVGSTFYMYFTRAETFVIDRICVATSIDGIHWEQKGLALDAGPEGAWDSLSVGRPSVIYDGGMFKLWYDGRKDFPLGTPVAGVPVSSNSHRYVGYATSKDGFNWQKQSDEPVFDNDAGGIDVKRLDDSYIMLYESHGGTRQARSPDGIQWNDAGWLVRKSGQDVDLHGHVTPFLFVDDVNGMWLFIGAARAASWDRNCIAILPLDLEFLKLRK